MSAHSIGRNIKGLAKVITLLILKPWCLEEYSPFKKTALSFMSNTLALPLDLTIPSDMLGEILGDLRSASVQSIDDMCTVSKVLEIISSALSTDDEDAILSASSQIVIAIGIGRFDEHFVRTLGYLAPDVLARILVHSMSSTLLYLLAGPSSKALEILFDVAFCYRHIIAPNQYDLTAEADRSCRIDTRKSATVLALIVLMTMPFSPDLLAARVTKHFSITLVELLNVNLLESILLIMELLTEPRYGPVESFAMLSALRATLQTIHSGRSISVLLIESLPGILYFISTQIWNEGPSTLKVWTDKELKIVAFLIHILGADVCLCIPEVTHRSSTLQFSPACC